MNGIRIVRIATHPAAQGMGYGSRALHLLEKYYEGELIDADCAELTDERDQFKHLAKEEKGGKGLSVEKLKPKKHLKPILQKLGDRKPLPIQWMGTSFGVTKELFNFWAKSQF